MTITPITFSDIQTSDLLYYDPDIDQECVTFCKTRNIDCLPSINNSKEFYRITNEEFKKEAITPEICLKGNEFIFDEEMFSRFRKNPLHFIYNNQGISGVVHFSDYNRPEVSTYLYALLSAYEKSLRNLLIQYGYNNQDMQNFFIYKINKEKKDTSTKRIYERNKSDFERNKQLIDSVPPFELFYLLDLIIFTRHMNIADLHQDINELRKSIMHTHILVHMENTNRSDYIYDFHSFEKFFKLVLILHQDYKKVNNILAFKTN